MMVEASSNVDILDDLLAFLAVTATRVSASSLLALFVRGQLCGHRAVSAVHASLEELLLLVAVFVVHKWFLDRDRNDVEDVRRLLEDQVHLLQGSVSCLWEEEVDQREDEGIDDGEYRIGIIRNGIEGDRGYHNN